LDDCAFVDSQAEGRRFESGFPLQFKLLRDLVV